jgi:fibronectin type 3 domain-containing protein
MRNSARPVVALVAVLVALLVVKESTAADTTPPSAPGVPAFSSITSTTATATWIAATDNVAVTSYEYSLNGGPWTSLGDLGVTDYRVERCSGAGCSNFAQIATPTTTAYSDTGLTQLTSYSYRVRAADGAGNLSAYSTIASAITPDGTVPSVPTGLTATAVSGAQINLSWTASTDNVAVTSYSAERCNGAGCSNFAVAGASTSPSYVDSGLASSTSYSYRVTAADAARNVSAYSTVANATTTAGASVIAYIQSNVATVSSGTSATVIYGAAQTPGDLNVVIVSWKDTTAVTPTVTDTNGNIYVAAIGPTHYSTGAQGIYYVPNIALAPPGSNTVTAAFPSSVTNLDVRVAEYGGIDATSPLDGGVGASGTATAMSSGNLTTTNANDLLVAGNYLGQITTAPGAGYIQRQLSSLSSILEDRVVSAVGSYAGTATQNTTGWWDMQMAAFRAADTQAPTAPTGLASTAVSSTQINLSWTASTDNVGVTDYLVERCQGAGCTGYAPIGHGPLTTFSDSGLLASTNYTYRVRAADAAGNLGAYSATSSSTTSAGDTQSPTAPTGLVATVLTSSQIALNWTASTDNVGVTNYSLERCQGASCTTYAQIAVPNTTTYTDNNLTASTSYRYRVRAVDAANNWSGYSSIASATTSAADVQAPTTPGTPSPTVVSSGQINLNWTAATDNVGVTGYFVERCQGAGCNTFAQVGAPTSASFKDSPLTASTSYSYRVRATDAAGHPGVYSNTSSAVTWPATDSVAPTVPGAFNATAASSSQVNLTWSASTDNIAVTAYRIERCQGASCNTFADIATATTTSYSDTTVLGSTSYSYRIRAGDGAGNLSAYSATKSVSTPASTDTQSPTQPTGLTALGGVLKITLSWTAATDNVGVRAYLIERCQGVGCNTFAQIGTVVGSPPAVTYTDPGLTPTGTTYIYRVRARDAANNVGSYSPTATAVCQICD